MGQYNRLGQRRASGAWQWLIIGFIPGLLCGGLILFGLFATNILTGFNSPQEPQVITSEPIQIIQVVTVTPDPLTTAEVMVVTATSAPTEEAVAGTIVQPTLAPFNTPVEVNAVVDEASATPAVLTSTDNSAQTVTEPTTQVAVASNDSAIPAELAGVVSSLREVTGGVFQYGADSIEIVTSAGLCQTRDSGQCTPAMGEDSTPQVQVELDTFWIEPNEVTFNQYEAFLNYLNSQGLRHLTGCQGLICIQTQNERPTTAVITFDGANYRIPANYETLRSHPAYGVSWYGAQAYCQAIGRRLPTEAEWEYAARGGAAGDNRVYPWGDNWVPTNANVRQPLSDGVDATVAITDFGLGVNPLGLSHMAGNVAEWVNDYYLDGYYQTISAQSIASGQPIFNPTGPAGGTQRVLRGGSFNSLPFFARTVHRQSYFPAPETPEESNYPLWVGFRCASDTGDATLPAVTTDGGVSPSNLLPTIPAVGNEADSNAQPTAPVDTESESGEGEESRG